MSALDMGYCLRVLKPGQAIVADKIEDVASSLDELIDVFVAVDAKGGSVRILEGGIDTATAAGQIMLTMLVQCRELSRSFDAGAFKKEIPVSAVTLPGSDINCLEGNNDGTNCRA